MINSKPNNNKYHQGNYIPINKEKVIKLNSEGGIYYRSSLEKKKMMVWFDNNDKIIRWCAECNKIPYQLTHYEKSGDINLKSHTYYPDFYYELEKNDRTTSKVICEVKPHKEYEDVILFEKKLFNVPQNATTKKLKNLEYRLKMAQKNSQKWKTMIRYCEKKGLKFIVITEQHLKSKKFN